MAKDYSKFSHEELVKFIEELQSQLKSEKYGLYWDRSIETEECITKCAVYMPLLERIDEKTLFFDKSDNNILLEGDNYHSLATLKMLSNGKPICDAIYIDPPYNTGNEDFAYNDNYVDNDDGYRHSKWLSFMESRLKIAREILAEDGCIFISIDDHEMANLKLLCDQIFGAKNFINCIAIKMSEMSGVKMAHINLRLPKLKEYCLVYSKSNLFEIKPIVKNRIENLEEFSKYAKYYSKIIEDRSLPIEQWNIIPLTEYISKNNIPIKTDEEILRFKIENAERMVYRTNNKSFSKIRCDKDITNIISPTGIEYIWWEGKQMLFLSDYTKSYEGDFWTDISTINLNKEGGVDYQNGKKPLKLLIKLFSMIKKENAVILDFFAGSGSTAEAILMMNKIDGQHRKFILCQCNEQHNNICTDVTYPRLKTVITGIRPDGTKYSDGIPANLIYYKTDFIKDSNNTDQAKYCLVEKVDELLCISEDIFIQLERNDYSSHYVSNDESRHMFIYFDYYNEVKFNEFKQRVLNATGTKIVYIFSSDNNVDETLFEGIKDVEVKPIPSKIYEIYKEIVEDIKRG